MNQIEYNGEKISFELYRRKIKNIYIYIKENQVIVKAPIRIKEEYIFDFVNKKAKWIYEKIKENEKRPKIEEKIEPQDVEKLSEVVNENIKKYSKKLQVMPNKVRIRNLKYAWGSCSSNRNISINLQLAKKEEKAIEYVVLHEMCHLIYMNHSKKFWDLVEKYMPKYKEYRKILSKTS